ncbi:LPXTG cell wall anchor domain-containing protein [Streptococcus pyogenes]|nr:LPXTG cell wall anchor domain-containing protein [Streptococcus pyogenes]VGQ31940.1 antiphagocytic M protein Emm [Streptococcus pyogenes]VGV03763.1 antiphagocytic M protein Emm [Streptococcus pyogenes]VHB67872.1 antiphagocytic M protein Emm [Streptococcus pyogenes]HEP1337172.1 YSIRK-type signal peptide-containing protein [Streptococcus pyogenes]HEP6140778.1 YSIRK-type signal peptide-containing protein [Streptococcus pyogenes]
MARKDTNKQYSLRKLKTGTASVAVAVAVLGAGFANQTEVKAEEASPKNGQLTLQQKYDALTNENKSLRKERDNYLNYLYEKEELEKKNKELHSELASVTETLTSVTEADDKKIKDLTDRDKISSNLIGNAKDQINKLTTEKDKLAEKAKKLEEGKQISDASRQGLSRDLEASRAAKKELETNHQKLEAEHQKLKEDKQISDASRQGLSRDLEASREAKKKVEADLAALTAEHQKLKEEKQISDASRQGLSRDLEASREAKKKVEADLAEANSKLQALEKLNKELEEGKKLSEKEKAELQARLEAEAKALKEQLAKQAEELAKLKGNQTPNAKVAPQANRSRSAMTQQKRTLPSTGEAANPFFTAAAATVMVSAGMLALKRKEEN